MEDHLANLVKVKTCERIADCGEIPCPMQPVNIAQWISTQSDGKLHFAIEELQTCQPKESMSRKLTCRFSSLEVIDFNHQQTTQTVTNCHSSQEHPPSHCLKTGFT